MSKYNTFTRRLGAGILDSFALMPLTWMNLIIWRSVDNSMALAGWFVLETILQSSYSILMHDLYGQTLGKMVCRIKVLEVSGTRLSMHQAVLRDLLPLIFGIYLCGKQIQNVLNGNNNIGIADSDIVVLVTVSGIWLLLELITMLSNKKRRSIHDYIAGSVVVRHPWNEEKEHYIGENSPFNKRVLKVSIVIMLLNAVLPPLLSQWPQKLPDGSSFESTSYSENSRSTRSSR